MPLGISTKRNLSSPLGSQTPFCQLRASRAVTNFVCSYSLSFIVTLSVVIILLTAGFACNCKGFFATVSEANNCEQGEQLTNRHLRAQRARQMPICRGLCPRQKTPAAEAAGERIL